MKISAYQLEILELMDRGHELRNDYEGEGAPYRPDNGMFSGWIETNSRSRCIPYRTIASLLKSGHIEETHRSTHTGHSGSTPYEVAKITYGLTEKGREAARKASGEPPLTPVELKLLSKCPGPKTLGKSQRTLIEEAGGLGDYSGSVRMIESLIARGYLHRVGGQVCRTTKQVDPGAADRWVTGHLTVGGFEKNA